MRASLPWMPILKTRNCMGYLSRDRAEGVQLNIPEFREIDGETDE